MSNPFNFPSIQIRSLTTQHFMPTDRLVEEERRETVLRMAYEELLKQNEDIITDRAEHVVGQGKTLIVGIQNVTFDLTPGSKVTTVSIGQELQSTEYGVLITMLDMTAFTANFVENRTETTFDVRFSAGGTRNFSWLIIY